MSIALPRVGQLIHGYVTQTCNCRVGIVVVYSEIDPPETFCGSCLADVPFYAINHVHPLALCDSWPWPATPTGDATDGGRWCLWTVEVMQWP